MNFVVEIEITSKFKFKMQQEKKKMKFSGKRMDLQLMGLSNVAKTQKSQDYMLSHSQFNFNSYINVYRWLLLYIWTLKIETEP